MTAKQYLIHCVSCALHGRKAILSDDIRLDSFYALCEKHHVAPMVYDALEGVASAAQLHPFEQSRNKAIARTAIQQNESALLSGIFQTQGIKAVHFKGDNISRLYPSPEMRVSSDIDFLIDAKQRDNVKAVMEQQGYQTMHFKDSDVDVYYKLPVLNVEIHTCLFEDHGFNGYFDDYLKRAVMCGEGFRFSQADFYIYAVAHFYKHYNASGCGIRFLIDHYLLGRAVADADLQVNDELEKIGLLDFKMKMDTIAQKWFADVYAPAAMDDFEGYILASGIYGTTEGNIQNKKAKLTKKYGKRSAAFIYCLKRLFPTYRQLCTPFPVLRRYPFLLPFVWIFRWGKGLTKIKKIAHEIKLLLKKEKYQKDI